MKNRLSRLLLLTALTVFALFFSGCASNEVLASEDIEVPILYKDLIDVLKDPNVRPNSKEKFEAINELIKHVDFTLTRETKTLDDLLSYRDAIMEDLGNGNRTLTFNYQYGDHYTRLRFFAYNIFIYRVNITRE